MKQEIIKEIVADSTYINYCKRVCNRRGTDLYKDLYQHIILMIMEMPDSKIERLYKEGVLDMYVARMIYLNATSPTSQFYRQMFDANIGEYTVKKDYSYNDSQDNYYDGLLSCIENIPDSERSEVDKLLDKFDEEMKVEAEQLTKSGIYPSVVKLYEIYEEKKSYTKVAKATKIKYKTVRNNINVLRDKIIKRVNDKNIISNAI